MLLRTSYNKPTSGCYRSYGYTNSHICRTPVSVTRLTAKTVPMSPVVDVSVAPLSRNGKSGDRKESQLSLVDGGKMICQFAMSEMTNIFRFK